MADIEASAGARKASARAVWALLRRPSAQFSLLTLVAGGFVAGIVFWGGFNTAMEATNTMSFCTSCHEMRDNVYKEYRTTIHYQNRTGVQATCSDCHVPREWVHKVARKIQASNELLHWAIGSIDTPEKFDAKRLQLATNVWHSMKRTDSRECRNCHTLESMNPEFQRPRARKVHLDAIRTGQTCIDCHKGVAHTDVRHRLPEAELEALEQPNAAFARAVPQTFVDGLRRAEERDAQEADRKRQDTETAEAAVKTRVEQAVAQAVAAQAVAAQAQAKPAAPLASGAAGAPSGAEGSAATAAAPPGLGVDWSGVEARTVTLFYPGEASFEWAQSREHGGMRAFTRGGDKCSTCHAKEVKDMGAKLVSGQKLESTPIPGKRPWIDVEVRAVHDGTNLALRFEWADARHAPAPFAPDGKMDPQNQTKLAMMIAGPAIERVEQAGCWATCHHDSRSMPDARKVDPSRIAGLVQDGDLKEGLTKYLAESRSQIDLQGRSGPRGGGDKVKGADDLAGLAKAGAFMDLIRARSGAPPENGHVLAQRVMEGGAAIEADTRLEAGRWSVTVRRPLRSDKPGDISIEPGKLYTIGFAIHDDFANARFHHVSLEMKFGLDVPEADINATKR